MKIVRVTWRLRSDFYALYECEFCQHKFEGDGYDDAYYFQRVLPDMKCSSCGKSSNSESPLSKNSDVSA